MMHVFYLEPERWSGVFVLDGAEAIHARAARVARGETVKVLNGEGAIALCRVAELKKKQFVLEVESITEVAPPVSRAVMAIAVSKAARRGFFLEKAAELGAWEIWLWHAERSLGKPSPDLIEACKGKLVAGCKQSANPWLPRLRALHNVDSLVEASDSADWRILPWESQENLPMLDARQLGRPGVTVYVIGPEGGFTEKEVISLRNAGYIPASLGQRVLRCETAATLCLGLHWWASQLPENVRQ